MSGIFVKISTLYQSTHMKDKQNKKKKYKSLSPIHRMSFVFYFSQTNKISAQMRFTSAVAGALPNVFPLKYYVKFVPNMSTEKHSAIWQHDLFPLKNRHTHKLVTLTRSEQIRIISMPGNHVSRKTRKRGGNLFVVFDSIENRLYDGIYGCY